MDEDEKTLCDFSRDIFCKHCGINFGRLYEVHNMQGVKFVKCSLCHTNNDIHDMIFWLQHSRSEHRNQALKLIDFTIYDMIIKSYSNYKSIPSTSFVLNNYILYY